MTTNYVVGSHRSDTHKKINDFEGGVAIVYDENGYGAINTDGKIIIPCGVSEYLEKVLDDEDNSYRGYKKSDKWCAQIQPKKKVIRLGFFNNEEDAAKAYDIKALELFGEFSRLNFPK
jgi:hypothetical protein